MSRLVPYPGQREALKRMFHYTPYAIGVYLVLSVLIWSYTSGKATVVSYLVAVAIVATLSVLEAMAQAKEIVQSCFGTRDRNARFAELAGIGTLIALGIWLPVAGIVAALSML